MQLFRHKNFTKQYQKLSADQQALIDEAVFLFYRNPFDPKLRNHPLKGTYKDCNSIDAAFDLRIIFKKVAPAEAGSINCLAFGLQEKNYVVVILLRVGSHNQLY